MPNPISTIDRVWAEPELWNDAQHPPTRAGVYAWFFDQAPRIVPVKGCLDLDGRHLLYFGISPARAGSRQHLRRRLRQHFRGNARGSTLRKTLGCLLQDELALEFRRVSARSARFTPESEATLTAWMVNHARVGWIECDEPWIAEAEAIGELSLPLNLRGNEQHPFHGTLTDLRSEMVRRARELPVWTPGQRGDSSSSAFDG